MAASFELSLIPGCRLEGDAGAPRVLHSPRGELPLASAPPAIIAAVEALLAGEASEQELAAGTVAAAGYDGLKALYRLLFTLHERLLLAREVRSDGALVASCVPLVPGCRFSAEAVEPQRPYVLSRFAHLRRDGDRMVLESPLSLARVTLRDARGAAVVAALGRPATPAEVQTASPGLGEAAVRGLVDLLHYADLLSAVGPRGEAAEDREPALAQWEFHDLVFHSRSRAGRHDQPYGGTFRLRGRSRPLPALKPATDAETVELYRPDVGRSAESDLPFSRVLETRRSRREHGEPALSVQELGEFLYRTLRAREVVDAPAYEVARRVYPGGGAAYELEVYLAVNRCDGLEPGLYHYRPLAHRLSRISGRTAAVASLLRGAARAADTETEPQVLIVLAARFGRLFWKYSSMAYATVLKDVGVVYQTLYLAATAMGLAACAIGGGDSDLFAAAAGTDYYEETSVGELILGRPARE